MKKVVAVTSLLVLLAACASPASPTLDYGDVPDFVSENLIPVLTAPAGAELMGGGGGGGNNSMGIGVVFTSDLGTEDVYEHYFDQLAAAGWRFISREDSEGGVISFWELTDGNGSTWPAKLVVAYDDPSAPDAYAVDVMVIFPR